MTEPQYCLLISGNATNCVGSLKYIREVAAWNSCHYPKYDYGVYQIPPDEVATWEQQFVNHTDRGVEYTSPTYLTPPKGTLVTALMAALTNTGFNLETYPKEPWYAIKALMREGPGSHHLLIQNTHSTHVSPKLNYSRDSFLISGQELMDAHSSLEYSIYQIEREGWPHSYLVAVDSHDPLDGTLVRLAPEAAIAVLRLSQTNLPPAPIVDRSEEVIKLAPDHLAYYYEVEAEAARRGLSDAFQAMISRCIHYGDHRFYYQCLLSPAPDLGAMSFYWSPQTRERGRDPWRSIVDGGIKFDETEKIWRFSS